MKITETNEGQDRRAKVVPCYVLLQLGTRRRVRVSDGRVEEKEEIF